MRLDKFLSEKGLGSRTDSKERIRQGQITVNGQVVKDPSVHVSESDQIACNGSLLDNAGLTYYLFYKPSGCVCANEDSDTTVFAYVPQTPRKDLFTVGRLDKDTTGLLLITNDGAFAHRMTAPRHHAQKTYLVTLKTPLTQDKKAELETGIDIGDLEKTKPAIVEIVSEYQIKLTIYEGRYHQVKRMLKAVGNEVVGLHRLSMGDFSLPEDLLPGEYRKFTEEELGFVQMLL